jgi:hypothetical protein
MRNRLIAFVATAILASVPAAFAQDTRGNEPGAARMEVSAFPTGGLLFNKASNSTETDFRNYTLGVGFTYNFNRLTAIEAEGGFGLGITKLFSYAVTSTVPVTDADGNPMLDDQGNIVTATTTGTVFHREKSPRTLGYQANIVYSPAGSNHAFVPYVTGGMGGLTVFARPELNNEGLTKDTTYLTGNAGAGLKWFMGQGWGLRVDYRLLMVKKQTNAPGFFAQTENRYGNRVYGSIVYTFGK